MKSFFTKALLGVAAVQGARVSIMSQSTAEAEAESQISTPNHKAGKSEYIRCPYNDNMKDRLHNGLHVTIDGVQTATADNKTDDPVTMYFSFEDMGLENNNLRGRLYSATGRTARKAAGRCELPNPAPAFISEFTQTNSDESENVALKSDIPGATFSIFDQKNVLRGRTATREKLIWHFDAHDEDGTYVDIGCCVLELENDSESIAREYQRVYGPQGLLSTTTVWNAVQEKYKYSSNSYKDKWCMLQSTPAASATDANVVDVTTTTTVTASTGTTTHANSVIAGLSATEKAIPQIQSIAQVTTTGGFCGGFDLVYRSGTTDVDVYNTGLGSTVATATTLTDGA